MQCKDCLGKEVVRGLKCVKCLYCGENVTVNYAFSPICEPCAIEHLVCQCCGKAMDTRRTKMTLTMENRDLFTIPQGYYLAHCIAADFALGAGIAKAFTEVYNMRNKLKTLFPMGEEVGTAVLVDNVFNLITKERSFGKPTYAALREALEDMKEQMEERMITKLAMPLIGCGLDKLEWDAVEPMIREVFNDTDVEIIVCYL